MWIAKPNLITISLAYTSNKVMCDVRINKRRLITLLKNNNDEIHLDDINITHCMFFFSILFYFSTLYTHY